jgi:hypothetical protein
MWRACNLTLFTPCPTGPVDNPFASRHEGPGLNPQGGTYVKPGFSCWRCLVTLVSPTQCDHWLRCPSVGASLGSAPTMWKASCYIAVQWVLHKALRRQCVSRLDLTQLFCPGFMLAAGPPSSFTTDKVRCWGGGALWRACNLTTFTPCLTGPVDYPFTSCHEGLRFKPQGGTYVKPWFSC